MSKQAPAVEWSRPVVTGAAQRLVYTSKCGRFTIKKMKWSAPSASTSYILARVKDGKRTTSECETLAEAKELAKGLVGECGDRLSKIEG